MSHHWLHSEGRAGRERERVRHSVIMDGNDPQWRRREEEVNSSEDQKSFHLHVRQHGHQHSRLLPGCVLRDAQRSESNRLSAISCRHASDAASAIRGPSLEAKREKYAVSSRAEHHFFFFGQSCKAALQHPGMKNNALRREQ